MLSAGVWQPNQANTITFVMVDSAGDEVTGLGGTFTLQVAKHGGSFAASAGTKSEIGNGWYRYTATAAEADTIGPIAVIVTASGAVQQNLEYVVLQRNAIAQPFTYTLTDDSSSDPIEGVRVQIATDVNGSNPIWTGYTDVFGIARDVDNGLPYLDPGTYYIFRYHGGYIFENPDTEVVS